MEVTVVMGDDDHQTDMVNVERIEVLKGPASVVDFFDYRRIFFAPNVTMDLTDRTKLTIEGSRSSNDWSAIQGGTPSFIPPIPLTCTIPNTARLT